MSSSGKLLSPCVVIFMTLLCVSLISSPAQATTKDDAKAYAQSYMQTKYGWDTKQFACASSVFNYESHWNYKDKNSKYLGIPQVNAGFVRSQGYSKQQFMSDYKIQIRVGLTYIKKRYGTPCKAASHIHQNGWY